MEALLKASEASALMGVSMRHVRRMAQSGALSYQIHMNAQNRPEYLFPLSSLPDAAQQKYFAEHAPAALPAAAPAKAKKTDKPAACKPLEAYTAEERGEIGYWITTVDRWQTYRNKAGTKKAECDEKFVLLCRMEEPDRQISVETLYRKWAAIREGDYGALVDMRGKARKGMSKMPEAIERVFLSLFLDESQLPVPRCIALTEEWAQQNMPEAMPLPGYHTFYRKAKAVPYPVMVLCRMGEKKYYDLCSPYIRREYESINANDFWVGDMAALAVSLLPVIGAFILDTVLPAILSGLGSLIVTVISAIGAWPVLLLAVLASIAAVIINYLVTHWDEIKQNFSQTLADLAQALNTAGENLQHIWDTLWLTIKLLGLQIWESITTGWSNFWKGLSLLLSMAGAALNAVWTAAWSALADTVSSIWDGITSVVRGAVNGIIRIINGMISAIVGGMNAVIGLLNGFSFDVPEFAQDALGTAKIGFNIDPITAPQIPYLAQGAVIPANHEFLAVLGDQTNGTNVEAPLETIQQALAEVLAEWGGQDITIRFAASGGLEQLVRLLMPYIDKEKARRGARLVVGGN